MGAIDFKSLYTNVTFMAALEMAHRELYSIDEVL